MKSKILSFLNVQILFRNVSIHALIVTVSTAVIFEIVSGIITCSLGVLRHFKHQKRTLSLSYGHSQPSDKIRLQCDIACLLYFK